MATVAARSSSLDHGKAGLCLRCQVIIAHLLMLNSARIGGSNNHRGESRGSVISSVCHFYLLLDCLLADRYPEEWSLDAMFHQIHFSCHMVRLLLPSEHASDQCDEHRGSHLADPQCRFKPFPASSHSLLRLKIILLLSVKTVVFAPGCNRALPVSGFRRG